MLTNSDSIVLLIGIIWVFGLELLLLRTRYEIAVMLEIIRSYDRDSSVKYKSINTFMLVLVYIWMISLAIYILSDQNSNNFLIFLVLFMYCIFKPICISVEWLTFFYEHEFFKYKEMLLIAITFGVFSIQIVLGGYILYSLFFRYVILCPLGYALMSNIWAVNILLNCVLRIRYMIPAPLMVAYSMIICGFGCSPFMPSDWVEGFGLDLMVKVFLVHLITIAVLCVQHYYGSLFFLPQRFRKRLLDTYLKQIEIKDQQNKHEYWRIWMNRLDEPELEYSDSDSTYKWRKFEIGIYFETACKHTFHPNCLYKKLREAKECPVCEQEIPEDKYWD